MIKLTTRLALLGFFAVSLLPAPMAFAESGTTSSGGSSSTNAGSSGDKADKSTQENSESADKNKQK